MILENVPYFEDKKEKFASCQGPPTVFMAFKFFLPNEFISFPKLYREMSYIHATWFFETYIARLFHKYKIPVRYLSTKPITKIGQDSVAFAELTGLNLTNLQERDEVDVANYDSSVEYLQDNNLFELKDEISFDFIKDQIKNNKLVVATVNRNKLTNKPGFKGHFLLVKGFNRVGFICNDSYLGENLTIPYSLFESSFYSSRKESGKTLCDADIVVIG